MCRANREPLREAVLLARRDIESRDLNDTIERVLDVKRHTGAIGRGPGERTDMDLVGAKRRTDLPDRREIERWRLVFEAADPKDASRAIPVAMDENVRRRRHFRAEDQ